MLDLWNSDCWVEVPVSVWFVFLHQAGHKAQFVSLRGFSLSENLAHFFLGESLLWPCLPVLWIHFSHLMRFLRSLVWCQLLEQLYYWKLASDLSVLSEQSSVHQVRSHHFLLGHSTLGPFQVNRTFFTPNTPKPRWYTTTPETGWGSGYETLKTESSCWTLRKPWTDTQRWGKGASHFKVWTGLLAREVRVLKDWSQGQVCAFSLCPKAGRHLWRVGRQLSFRKFWWCHSGLQVVWGFYRGGSYFLSWDPRDNSKYQDVTYYWINKWLRDSYQEKLLGPVMRGLLVPAASLPQFSFSEWLICNPKSKVRKAGWGEGDWGLETW